MKKQKLTSISLHSIARVTSLKGGDEGVNKNTGNLETTTSDNCPQNTQFPVCLTTVSTRPDSFNTYSPSPNNQQNNQ